MALSQVDIDALDAAIATSELEVEVDGKRVKYRSTSELLQARAHVSNVVTAAASGVGARRTGAYRFNMITSRE